MNIWLWIVLIVISTDDAAYLMSMFSLASRFLYFLQHLLQEYVEHET